MTWLAFEPEDEPTTIRPYLLPEEPQLRQLPPAHLLEEPELAPQPAIQLQAVHLPQLPQPQLAQPQLAQPQLAQPQPAQMPMPEVAFAGGSNRVLEDTKRSQIGKYELRDKLGRGSFGVVYLARDPSLDRDIAIKVLRPQHLTNGDIVQRFLKEARTTARIAHPGIVTIYDCGLVETTLGATAFIAMEILTGESLTQRLARSGRLPPETAAEIGRQVASALDAAHRVDVLHRDLKPDNIYLVPDPAMPSGERVKILDFGLAKLGNSRHTQVENVFGTPRYMSPEQCRSSAQVDHRSDIYALGCILFELVAGRPPFDGDVRTVIERHQRTTPPRARSFSPDCPAAFDDLIAEMLAKDPKARPQSMGAVQRALADAGAIQIPVAETMLPTPAHQLMMAAAPAPAPMAAPAPIRNAADTSGQLIVPGTRDAQPEAPARPERPGSHDHPAPRPAPLPPSRPGTLGHDKRLRPNTFGSQLRRARRRRAAMTFVLILVGLGLAASAYLSFVEL